LNENQLRQFICVAYEKNLTKAAKKLYITQQALSKAMNALEEELGVKLFIRSGKGTELTDVGEKILPVAESMLKKHEEHMEIVNMLIEKSRYTITLLFEHQLMPYVIPPDFISRIGNMRIQSTVSSDLAQCIHDVSLGKFDLGFVHKPNKLKGLVYIPVICERPLILMNKKHFLADKKIITISDLSNVTQLSPAINSSVFKEYIEACINHGFYPNFVFEYPDLELLLRSVSANIGVTISASFGLPEGNNFDITARPLVHDSLMMEVGFITKPDYESKLHLSSFINAIRNYYAI